MPSNALPSRSARALKRLPRRTYRVMPYRWVCWIYRAELARGQEQADRRGWTD